MTRVIKQWMIYGANGYSGEIIAREAVRRGHLPILAGRNEEAVLALAAELDLPYQVFALDHPHKIKAQLNNVQLVLNCAGPFVETAAALRDVCVANSVHYLDITGEIDVLEQSYVCNEQARSQGAVVISGVGFDVVPTDVLAAKLKQVMPDASHLELAFAGGSGVSQGTAKTALNGFNEGGKIREDGKIKTVAINHEVKTIDFYDEPRSSLTVAWGDIATAFYTTEIPNIKVFTHIPENQIKWLGLVNALSGIMKFQPIKKLANKYIDKYIAGPNEQQRSDSLMQLWGKVSNGSESIELTMQSLEGYHLTIVMSLYYVEAILAHKIMPGAYTPSQAIDFEQLLQLDALQLHDDETAETDSPSDKLQD